MITYALSISRSRFAAWVFLVAGLLLLARDVVAQEAPDEKRWSLTSQGTRAERDAGVLGGQRSDEYDALLSGTSRNMKNTPTMASQSDGVVAQSSNVDFWFYAADVELFNDHDRDGYFHGIDLWFDHLAM